MNVGAKVDVGEIDKYSTTYGARRFEFDALFSAWNLGSSAVA